jgi:hypothetical protein
MYDMSIDFEEKNMEGNGSCRLVKASNGVSTSLCMPLQRTKTHGCHQYNLIPIYTTVTSSNAAAIQGDNFVGTYF